MTGEQEDEKGTSSMVSGTVQAPVKVGNMDQLAEGVEKTRGMGCDKREEEREASRD